ncbi:MAG TPA: DNA-3-methyladenine glycosylase [Chloroflexota bacterium]|jgi:DNA-3-methyladenine glycosylase II
MLDRFLAARGPFRFDLALRYYRSSPSTIAEVVDERSYRRAFRAPAGPAVLTAVGADGGLRVAVAGPGGDEAGLAQASVLVGRAFGLGDDARGLVAAAARDGALAERLRRYLGLRPLAIPDPFEALVWAILGQQINVAFAARLKRVLLERYGPAVEVGGRAFRLFPGPDRLADVGPEELRPLQFSRQKALYLGELARAIVDGRVDLEALRARADDEVVAEITRLKGIGRWTAEYLLLRGFGRSDAIPAGDMGLRAIVGRLDGLGRNATEAEVRTAAEPFAPYRGYLAMALWFALQQREY